MPLLVRRALPGDLGSVVRLWREMWDFHAPLDPRFASTPAAESVMAGWIGQNMESERAAVFVAEGTEGVEGYLLAMILENPPVIPDQFYGYVSEISVRRRRRGTGALLLEAARAWFKEHGLPYAEVNVSVRNEVARNFWRKHGFADFLERLRVEL